MKIRTESDVLAAIEAQRAAAAQAAPPPAPAAPPAKPVSFADLWAAAIEAKTASGMSQHEAVRAVVRERPDLHRAWLREITAADLARRTRR